jgi:UDP-N-acetylmuramoylalanine--D-glutamate ligase
MELGNKKILILGLARTGCATARFLVQRGAEAVVTDRRSAEELKKEVDTLAGLPVRYRLGGEDVSWLEGVDHVIPSPGVPPMNSILQEAQRRGVEILSEIELAYRFLGCPLIAVTGTNGKSTATTLIGEMLKAHGFKAFVGGNIGRPLIDFVNGPWDWGVAEISSFQLEWVDRFRPRIAVLLNLTEDHLDRYPDLASYGAAKERIFSAQDRTDVAVLNRADPFAWGLRGRLRARIVSFGWDEARQGVIGTEDAIVWRDEIREERFPLSGVKIQGVHNVENLMAAVAVAKVLHIPREIVQRVMEEFRGLEHRLESVREKDGVRFYNDSKGTNVGAVLKSLQSFSGPVILIAGGVDKGGDYRILAEEIRRKVKKLILFGAAKEAIRRALGDLTETLIVESLATAVAEAHRAARAGDTVLFSPACSSFDMFRDYAERGRTFKALVESL